MKKSPEARISERLAAQLRHAEKENKRVRGILGSAIGAGLGSVVGRVLGERPDLLEKVVQMAVESGLFNPVAAQAASTSPPVGPTPAAKRGKKAQS